MDLSIPLEKYQVLTFFNHKEWLQNLRWIFFFSTFLFNKFFLYYRIPTGPAPPNSSEWGVQDEINNFIIQNHYFWF